MAKIIKCRARRHSCEVCCPEWSALAAVFLWCGLECRLPLPALLPAEASEELLFWEAVEASDACPWSSIADTMWRVYPSHICERKYANSEDPYRLAIDSPRPTTRSRLSTANCSVHEDQESRSYPVAAESNDDLKSRRNGDESEELGQQLGVGEFAVEFGEEGTKERGRLRGGGERQLELAAVQKVQHHGRPGHPLK